MNSSCEITLFNKIRPAQVVFTRSGWRQFFKLNRSLGARFIRGFVLRYELAAYLTAHEAAGAELDEGCQEVCYENGIYLLLRKMQGMWYITDIFATEETVTYEPAYALDRACFSAGQNAQYSMNVGEEKAPTLVADGLGTVAAPAAYLVRRLTPGECCRLQGYPDGWCENLESPAPSNKEADRWEAIFEEWRTAMGGKTNPKTRRQIIRWLQNPHTDSAEYKAYGNSIVAQCAFFVLAGIVWATEEGEQNENDFVDAPAVYQNAPSFAYVIGDYTVSKTGK